MSRDLKHINDLKRMSDTGLVQYFHSLQERALDGNDVWTLVRYIDAKHELEERGLI